MIFVATEKERNMVMANCENCIKSDVCKYYEPKSTVACERYSMPVRHAKWELIDECVNEGVYCSNCHKKIYRAEYANQKVKSNYCPNCGAKMDGNEVE